MRNFYTVFDFKDNKVKLAVNKANAWANSNMIRESGLSGIVKAIIVIATILLLILIVYLLYRLK